MNLAVVTAIVLGMFLLLILVYRFTSDRSKQPAPKANYPVGINVDKNSKQPMSESESVGSISTRLGADVREVWELGYSEEQINGVLTENYTLDEMYKLEPQGNTMSAKGREILAKKVQD